MISAKEAHKIATEDNSFARVRDEELKRIVEKALPVIEKEIRSSADYGFCRTMVKRETIMGAIGYTFYSKACVMEIIAEELRNFGYTTFIPESHCSIHIEW